MAARGFRAGHVGFQHLASRGFQPFLKAAGLRRGRSIGPTEDDLWLASEGLFTLIFLTEYVTRLLAPLAHPRRWLKLARGLRRLRHVSGSFYQGAHEFGPLGSRLRAVFVILQA